MSDPSDDFNYLWDDAALSRAEARSLVPPEACEKEGCQECAEPKAPAVIKLHDITPCPNCGAWASCCELSRLRRDELETSTRLINRLRERLAELEDKS